MSNSQGKGEIDWQELNYIIYDNIEKLIDIFGIELNPAGNGEWVGPCCIHDGDNPTAFRVYESGTCWCFTRGCCTDNISLLSFLKMMIEKHTGTEVNALYVTKWIVDNLLEGKNILALPKAVIKRIKTKHVDRIFFEDINSWQQFAGTTSRTYAREFSEEIVKKYHIGECHDRSHRFYNRIVVPHCDTLGRVIGYTGRSLYPQCIRCKLYHSMSAPCPADKSLSIFKKWVHCSGFRTGMYLYNEWNHDQIKEVILVESVGNCLRMIEANYKNVLGTYGASLSKGQVEKLESMGVRHINVIFDNDENKTGLNNALRVANRLEQFQFRILIPPASDVKEMSVADIQRWLKLKGVRYV